ncbi:hypothetical protein, partial [Acinetobacter sp.]|uniref:hypothetical protein n=1 Tax=Acinetobacter sp. TaxID=472 RepID=UPI002FD9027A
MKKTFQLSAVAIAIAASGSVMAGVTVNGTNIPVVVNDIAVSIDGLPAGNNVSASINSTGVNVNSVANTTTPTSNDVQGSSFSVATVGTANSTVPVAYTDTYTRSADASQVSQIYTPEKLAFSSKSTQGTEERQVSKTADANYDANGEFSGVNNVATVNDTGYVYTGSKTLSEDSIILGKENTGDENALTIRKTVLDANNNPQTTETSVTAAGVKTGTVTADSVVVAGTDVKATLDQHAIDIAANAAAIAQEVTDRQAADNAATTDRAAIRTEFAAADTTLQNNIDAEAATREAADNAATTDRAAIRTEFAAADTTLQNNIDAEAATREAADNAATTDRAAIRTEFAAADTTLQN